MNGHRSYTNEDMLNELRRVASLVDGPLSRPKFIAAKPRISAPAIIARFGGWLTAIGEAGLPAAYAFGGTWSNCPVCGDQFRVTGGSHGKKSCGKKACTSELMSRAGFQGDNVTPHGARGRAKKVKPIDQCERCGSEEQIERHHRDRDPYNNTPENVEVLCKPCHVAEHATGLCRKGHALYRMPSGGLRCRECWNAYQREYGKRQRIATRNGNELTPLGAARDTHGTQP